MRRILVGLVFTTLLVPFFVFAEQALPSFGLIKNTVWYSSDPFFAGTQIRVYSGLFNGSGEDVTGVASFYDNDSLVGIREFSIQAGGAFQQIWVDWVPTKGNHAIKVLLTSATIEQVGGARLPVALSDQPVGIDQRFIDSDTDGDQIGDVEDTDDDNDGTSDAEELRKGTNPLVADVVTLPVTSTTSVVEKTVQSVKNTLTSNIDFLNSTTSATVLDSVSNVAISTYKAISDFADLEEAGLRQRAADLDLEIADLRSKSEHVRVDQHLVDLNDALGNEVFIPESTRYDFNAIFLRWVKQAYALFLDLAIFIFSYEIIIHLLLAHILYKLIRWIVRRVTWRRSID